MAETQKTTTTDDSAELAAKAKKIEEGGGNPADLVGADQIQEAFDEATEKGYFGEVPDETPNENYTLKGVSEGKPTPETAPLEERTK